MKFNRILAVHVYVYICERFLLTLRLRTYVHPQLYCMPTWNLWGSYTLAIVAFAILAIIWRPLLYREPVLEYDLVRARSVPYTHVQGIGSYVPPKVRSVVCVCVCVHLWIVIGWFPTVTR